MLLAAIIVCEVAFWVAILAGLSARYLLRRPRLGAAFLIAAPLIDVVLLSLVAVDLLSGGTATWHHGLAALYIGVSVAYGRRMVAWADLRFAQRFAGGPRPEPMSGTRYAVKCWRDVLMTACGVAVAGAILGGIVLLVGDPTRTAALSWFFRILGIVLAVDVVWAVSYTIWPRRPAVERSGSSLG